MGQPWADELVAADTNQADVLSAFFACAHQQERRVKEENDQQWIRIELGIPWESSVHSSPPDLLHPWMPPELADALAAPYHLWKVTEIRESPVSKERQTLCLSPERVKKWFRELQANQSHLASWRLEWKITEQILLEDISGHVSKRKLAIVNKDLPKVIMPDQPDCFLWQNVCICGAVGIIYVTSGTDFNIASYTIFNTKLGCHGLDG